MSAAQLKRWAFPPFMRRLVCLANVVDLLAVELVGLRKLWKLGGFVHRMLKLERQQRLRSAKLPAGSFVSRLVRAARPLAVSTLAGLRANAVGEAQAAKPEWRQSGIPVMQNFKVWARVVAAAMSGLFFEVQRVFGRRPPPSSSPTRRSSGPTTAGLLAGFCNHRRRRCRPLS